MCVVLRWLVNAPQHRFIRVYSAAFLFAARYLNTPPPLFLFPFLLTRRAFFGSLSPSTTQSKLNDSHPRTEKIPL